MGKQAVEKRRGVGLLGVGKRLRMRAEGKDIQVRESAWRGRGSTDRENLGLGLFEFVWECGD